MSNSRPVPPASTSGASLDADRAAEVLDLMREALRLLDKHQGPHDAGAHLDDAINRLEEWMRGEPSEKD